ncbi:hypothetical protein SLG_25160 [Sphingobium sp. SYK-6]|nr:hypothetical protein SLG_25160 [Sphingobium sp. SYK-6]
MNIRSAAALRYRRAHVITLGAALAAAFVAAPVQAASECDRSCLQGMADQFVDAVGGKKTANLPLAADVRLTENGQTLSAGDGFWGTVEGAGRYRNIFIDTDTQQIGFIVVMKEAKKLALYAGRLQVKDGKFTEVETIISRSSGSGNISRGPAMLEERGAPHPSWSEIIPAERRETREQLVRGANNYFAAIELNDGHADYPFTDDCLRHENGVQTTNNPDIDYADINRRLAGQQGEAAAAANPIARLSALSCTAQFKTGFFRFVDRVRDRRFPVVDVERGAVFAFGFFDHSGTIRNFPLADGTMLKDFGPDTPMTWEIAEAFKLESGKIRTIEAVLTAAPYGMPSGWPGARDADLPRTFSKLPPPRQ